MPASGTNTRLYKVSHKVVAQCNVKIFRRANGVWYARLPHNKRLSLKTRDRAQAQRLFRRIKREILQGNIVALEKHIAITLAEFAQEYIAYCHAHKKPATAKRDAYSLNKLIDHLGGKTQLRNITVKSIDNFQTGLLAIGLKKSGVAITVRHVSAALSKAVEWDYLSTNPCLKAKKIKPDENPPRFYTERELRRIFAAIKDDQDWHDLITCYLFTGARRTELWALTRRDVDLQARLLTIRVSKSKWRTIPIDEPVVSILARRCAHTNVGRLWRTWGHPDAITHRWARLMIKLKMQGRIHDLRHTFASYLAKQGTSILKIQKLLGHSDIKTTMVYAHLVPEHLREEVAQLNKQLKSSTEPHLSAVSD